MNINETKILYREPSIDLIESIAIIFVLLYHSTIYSCDILGSGTVLDYARYFLRGFLACSVPLFFFANGYLLPNKPFILKKTYSLDYSSFDSYGYIGYHNSPLLYAYKRCFPFLLRNRYENLALGRKLSNHAWFMGALNMCVYPFSFIKACMGYQ